ncbi:polyprenyl synthetase family protein [Legionella cardiaca]|uniref:Polyprenyl synthetase family protein n=1 Tax=Legionella cardiaca TaxID=1071983 RepID=A0ABY8AUN1_9GAMM|nr:farnesyl diphosphate synthase [Legionella cardiaca]WED43464.1 polyprenyl synthetase family protein [Legionella cardiaca]
MINETIRRYLKQHETVLNTLISQADIPAARIKEAMLYTLFPGGKRLRPILVYLSGEITGVAQPNLDIMAAAIELIHCYSLIHDDLPAMDNDDLRRGKPSCHKAFDEATAILVGDGMQALAVDLLLKHLPQYLPSAQVLSITQELVHASGPAGMVSGQSLDLSQLSLSTISEEELRTIHALKTGKLISACFNMVLAASDTPASIVQSLRDFSTHLGLVFQMQDDYLDHYADAGVLGKGRASDVANEKLTFASLYSKDELFNLISDHFQLAKDALIPLGTKADDLIALTNYIQQRSHCN